MVKLFNSKLTKKISLGNIEITPFHIHCECYLLRANLVNLSEIQFCPRGQNLRNFPNKSQELQTTPCSSLPHNSLIYYSTLSLTGTQFGSEHGFIIFIRFVSFYNICESFHLSTKLAKPSEL